MLSSWWVASHPNHLTWNSPCQPYIHIHMPVQYMHVIINIEKYNMPGDRYLCWTDLVTHVEHWLHKLFIKLKWCDVGMAKIFVLAVLVFPVKCGRWCAQTYWANLIHLNNNEYVWLSELCVFAYICDILLFGLPQLTDVFSLSSQLAKLFWAV